MDGDASRRGGTAERNYFSSTDRGDMKGKQIHL